MKLSSHILLALLVSAAALHADNDWDNLEVLQINREKPHATLTRFPDAAAALRGGQE